MSRNRIMCWLFRLVWRRWMKEQTVLQIRGWRTALVTVRGRERGQRYVVTNMFSRE